MWSEQNNQEETESPYQAKQGEQPMIIDMSMYQTNIAMKYRKKRHLKPQIKMINHINVTTQYPSIHQKLPMCNQETGTRWSTHQMSYLLHLKFKLDPLNDLQWSRHFVDPAFQLMRFPLDSELDFNLKNYDFYLLRKWLGVATYFCFIFKGWTK